MQKALAISIAKLAGFSSKLLHMGSGSQLPGRLALKIYPNLLKDFAKEIDVVNSSLIKVAITGTNGKTTTTGILRSIFNKPLITNVMGANLITGVTSAFIDETSLSGNLNHHDYLLEVDEASLPKVGETLKPAIITVTNLFRDQLDRFGELDQTQNLINSGIENSKLAGSHRPILILNADDPRVRELGTENTIKVFYSVEDYDSDKEGDSLIKNFDSAQKTTKKVEADLKAKIFKKSFNHSIVGLQTSQGNIELKINLPGVYNVYNAVAAAATALAYNTPLEQIKRGIEEYSTNFGRAETKIIKDIETQTFLIKNPTGATEVMKHLAADDHAKFLIIINDNYADGRDVSWLWDAEFEHLKNNPHTITVSGKRAYDMALRLKYAGIEESRIDVEPDIKEALEHAIHLCEHKNMKKKIKETIRKNVEPLEKQKLYILPTYTSLLALEKLN